MPSDLTQFGWFVALDGTGRGVVWIIQNVGEIAFRSTLN